MAHRLVVVFCEGAAEARPVTVRACDNVVLVLGAGPPAVTAYLNEQREEGEEGGREGGRERERERERETCHQTAAVQRKNVCVFHLLHVCMSRLVYEHQKPTAVAEAEIRKRIKRRRNRTRKRGRRRRRRQANRQVSNPIEASKHHPVRRRRAFKVLAPPPDECK
jgi:hypothetical protein